MGAWGCARSGSRFLCSALQEAAHGEALTPARDTGGRAAVHAQRGREGGLHGRWACPLSRDPTRKAEEAPAESLTLPQAAPAPSPPSLNMAGITPARCPGPVRPALVL